MAPREHARKDPVRELGKRPRDYYPPEDWVCGSWEEDEARVKEEQAVWDRRYASLTCWQRIRHALGWY